MIGFESALSLRPVERQDVDAFRGRFDKTRLTYCLALFGTGLFVALEPRLVWDPAQHAMARQLPESIGEHWRVIPSAPGNPQSVARAGSNLAAPVKTICRRSLPRFWRPNTALPPSGATSSRSPEGSASVFRQIARLRCLRRAHRTHFEAFERLQIMPRNI